MHQAKVNTISVELPLPANKIAAQGAAAGYVGSIGVPYGLLCISPGDAEDHAHMRTRQLSSLLLLIHVDGGGHFDRLGHGSKEALLWLASQLADEMESMVSILVSDVAGSKA
jgi:hypothetical protein